MNATQATRYWIKSSAHGVLWIITGAVIGLALGLLFEGCSPGKTPVEPELIEEYIPTPVVRMLIIDGDTIYDANQ